MIADDGAGESLVDVVTIGETMVVMVPEMRGTLDSVDLFRKDFAGAESNVAIALCRLGHRAAWISRLGDDGFGRYIYGQMRAEGVDVSGVGFDPDHPTGMYIKELSAESKGAGTNVYYYRSNSAASHLAPDAELLIPYAKARYLFVTGITPALSVGCRELILNAIAHARQLGMTIVFDPNVRLKLWSIDEAREVLDTMARQADIVLSGLGEARLLTGANTPQEATRQYLDRGAQIVVIKLEESGAFYETESERGAIPAFSVHAVDEIGAGDAFDAGLISALLDGLPLPQAVERGCALGALAVTAVGDHAALPTRMELQHFTDTTGRGPDAQRA